MDYLLSVISAILLGYLAGLLSFKVKSRWCGGCGTIKSCPHCSGWARSSTSESRSRSNAMRPA